MSVVTERAADETAAVYNAESRRGRCEFALQFDQETEMVGYRKLKLWVEADGHDDIDLFVFLQKLDRHGKHLEVQTSGVANPIVGLMTHFTASVLKYHAAPGRMRASLRHVDPNLSSEEVPAELRPGREAATRSDC